jgi:hypothetical protein
MNAFRATFIQFRHRVRAHSDLKQDRLRKETGFPRQRLYLMCDISRILAFDMAGRDNRGLFATLLSPPQCHVAFVRHNGWTRALFDVLGRPAPSATKPSAGFWRVIRYVSLLSNKTRVACTYFVVCCRWVNITLLSLLAVLQIWHEVPYVLGAATPPSGQIHKHDHCPSVTGDVRL